MFPKEASGFDQINFFVKDANMVNVYISEAYQYSDPVAEEIELTKGDSYDVDYPNSFYVLVVSRTV